MTHTIFLRPQEGSFKKTRSVRETSFGVIANSDICIGYGLRVDHVSDVVWPATDDEKIPQKWRPRIRELKDANSLKVDGNAALKAGTIENAVSM